MDTHVVIVINPGSTSTKIAIYSRGGEIRSENIHHDQSDLDNFNRITDQLEYRYSIIKDRLNVFLNVVF